jgi:hypothetical protein
MDVRMYSNAGMMAGENTSARVQTCHNSALSTTNPNETVLEMNWGVLSEKLARSLPTTTKDTKYQQDKEHQPGSTTIEQHCHAPDNINNSTL